MMPIQAMAKNPQDQSPLGKIHQDIVSDYPALSHISRTELQSRLKAKDILILDTRPIKEYNVSHIPGAIQVEPKMDAKAFLSTFGPQLRNKNLIVYCSVGRRSSILGNRLQSTIMSAGAQSIANLEGGLFGWHNDGRPLENTAGPTNDIHPYNVFWGRLIEDKEDIRYRPE